MSQGTNNPPPRRSPVDGSWLVPLIFLFIPPLTVVGIIILIFKVIGAVNASNAQRRADDVADKSPLERKMDEMGINIDRKGGKVDVGGIHVDFGKGDGKRTFEVGVGGTRAVFRKDERTGEKSNPSITINGKEVWVDGKRVADDAQFAGFYSTADANTAKTTAKPASKPAESKAARKTEAAEPNPMQIAKKIGAAFNRMVKKVNNGIAWRAVFGSLAWIIGIPLALRVGFNFSVFPSDVSFAYFVNAIPLAVTAFGAALVGSAIAMSPRKRRYRRYAAVIGGNEVMRIADIAAATGYPERRVRDDLQRMVDSGVFTPETAFVDKKRDIFAYGLDAAKRYAKEEYNRAPNTPAPEPTKRETAEQVDEYERILRALRRLNDEIEDISISNKIERIERTAARIFEVVKENPSKLPQIRRLMNYYLPTTMKLLQSYAKFEKQGVSGENVETSKADIDRVLGTVAGAFERQLDQLYASDALDIAADISVLENMMARDGLSGTSAFGGVAQAIAEVETIDS
ncbi:MAG: 5-bromo-4-chloroindolyl phosphate hydrolysis family protein [Oscillospiraceae bacterium]|jgi:uncharacterized integral membrane protein|nr:5-bromo-4-chloroindolyl phosphate hydrolysis family protein [Oscillospiraceae bacterium]